MANKKIFGFALMFLLSLVFSIGSALALDCSGVQGPLDFKANTCFKDGALVSDEYCCECAGNWPSWKAAFCDGNYNTPTAGSGCTLASGGVPGCGNVASWGSTNINKVVKNAAQNDVGTTYMAWCPYTGGTPYAREVKAACDCPNLKPAPGTCVSGSCNSCGNPVTKCAPKKPEPPKCVDECNKGETKCVADDLQICGNFDKDKCTEWGFKKDCEYEKAKTYNVCEYEDSVLYKDIEKGYCKDVQGYNDYCAVKKSTKMIRETDCGVTDCEDDVYCKYNDVYGKESCTIKGCDEPSGKCYVDSTKKEGKIDECGSYSKIDEYCNGENVVYVETFRGCEESRDTAYCFEDPNTIVVDECGPDTCDEYTDLDIYTKEYIHDEESCAENGYAYCAYDPGDIYDYCLNTEILEQAYCDGNDHNFKEFDCTSLSGCYDFTYESCETCWDPYDYGGCKGEYCNKTGMRYRDYFCGDGACDYYELDMVDSDKDKLDDRCDDCIDADFDGICDDVDTCVGVFNPTQVDSDNDGYGNACDNDRDNDGYNAEDDCDDWNPDVNPGVQEIPNNIRDDDCNPNTPDKGTYTPRQALYVDVKYNEALIVPGKDMDILVSVKNIHRDRFEDLQISVSIPGYSERQVELIRVLEPGETDSELFELRIPNNLRSEFEIMRISVSNDYYKRIIYRELRLPESS